MATFATEVEARKRELGFAGDEATTEVLRNKGTARTPEKRAVLARMARRAQAAG